MPDIRIHTGAVQSDGSGALIKSLKALQPLEDAPRNYEAAAKEKQPSLKVDDDVDAEPLPTIQEAGPVPLWMDVAPGADQRLLQSIQISTLYSGSVFRGEQKSGRSSYKVTVTFQHVDLKESFLCGYLHIKGLTEDYPELTTFFEAEIIGPKHSFLTKKWEATDRTDLQHWDRFPSFRPYSKLLKKTSGASTTESSSRPPASPTFAPSNNNMPFTYHFRNKDHIFMRWKEQFLVPDYRVKTINGASFAGFYYICYQLSKEEITGYYFHQNSEKFQQLNLRHCPETTFQQFEFR